MQITAALAADLALLSDALGDPVTEVVGDITDTVLKLAADARLAARSYLGLTVIIGNAQSDGEVEPVPEIVLRFTLLDADADPVDVKTSLRLPPLRLPTDSRQPRWPAFAVILYASKPGAFLDLAADLSFLTGRQLSDTDLDQHRDVACLPDITGPIRDHSVIHEATGVLIARGRTRDHAHADLDALAVGAGTDRYTEALRILEALP